MTLQTSLLFSRGYNFSISIPVEKLELLQSISDQIPRRKRSAWILRAMEEKYQREEALRTGE